MIDMHAHILPCVDHGSVSPEMSSELFDSAENVGVDTIVATPHFYLSHGHTVSAFLEKRNAGLRLMREAIGAASPIRLRVGAEVNLRLGISEHDLSRLCINGTDTMLLEMPMTGKWQDWVYNEVSEILSKHKIKLLIAHIDRYDEECVCKLFEYFDLKGQINAESVVSFFSRRRVFRYLDMDIVHALGSDVHRSTGEYKNLGKCIKYIGEETMSLIERRSENILNGR